MKTRQSTVAPTLSPRQHHHQPLSPRTPQSARSSKKKLVAAAGDGSGDASLKTNKKEVPFWVQFLFPEQPRMLPAQMQVLALATPVGISLVITILKSRKQIDLFAPFNLIVPFIILDAPFNSSVLFFSFLMTTLFFSYNYSFILFCAVARPGMFAPYPVARRPSRHLLASFSRMAEP